MSLCSSMDSEKATSVCRLWSQGALDRASVCASSCYLFTRIVWAAISCISVQEWVLHLKLSWSSLDPYCGKGPCCFYRTADVFLEEHTLTTHFQQQETGIAGQVEYAPLLLIYFFKVISTHAHETEHFFTYPSHLWQAPLPGSGLYFRYPCFPGWRVACQYQGLHACHLSQLSSIKADNSSQADWHGLLVQAGPSCQMLLMWTDQHDHFVLQEAPCFLWPRGYNTKFLPASGSGRLCHHKKVTSILPISRARWAFPSPPKCCRLKQTDEI